jgi:hypothetical protein
MAARRAEEHNRRTAAFVLVQRVQATLAEGWIGV